MFCSFILGQSIFFFYNTFLNEKIFNYTAFRKKNIAKHTRFMNFCFALIFLISLAIEKNMHGISHSTSASTVTKSSSLYSTSPSTALPPALQIHVVISSKLQFLLLFRQRPDDPQAKDCDA